MKVKEVIIVEGRDDITAVKAAVEAEVIATGGARISKNSLDAIEKAYHRCGIIILTDPDYAGEKIRKRLAQLCPKAKHAFISKDKAIKKEDIGVENSDPQTIRRALEEAKAEYGPSQVLYEKSDLSSMGLVGRDDSKLKRQVFTDILGIGYCNGKQLLARLNNFAIGKEEVARALEEMEGRLNG